MLEKYRRFSSNHHWMGLLCLLIGLILAFTGLHQTAMFAGLAGAYCFGVSLFFKIRGFMRSKEIAGVEPLQHLNLVIVCCLLGLGGLFSSTLMFFDETLPVKSLVFGLVMFLLANYYQKKQTQ